MKCQIGRILTATPWRVKTNAGGILMVFLSKWVENTAVFQRYVPKPAAIAEVVQFSAMDQTWSFHADNTSELYIIDESPYQNKGDIGLDRESAHPLQLHSVKPSCCTASYTGVIDRLCVAVHAVGFEALLYSMKLQQVGWFPIQWWPFSYEAVHIKWRPELLS